MKGFNFGESPGFNFNKSSNPIIEASNKAYAKVNPFASYVTPLKDSKRALFSQISPPKQDISSSQPNIFSQPFNTDRSNSSDSEMNIDSQPSNMSFSQQSHVSSMSISQSQSQDSTFSRFARKGSMSAQTFSPPSTATPSFELPPTPKPGFFTQNSPTLRKKTKRKCRGHTSRKRRKVSSQKKSSRKESPRKGTRRRGTKRHATGSRSAKIKRVKRRSSVDDLVDQLNKSDIRDEAERMSQKSAQSSDIKTEDSSSPAQNDSTTQGKRPSSAYSFTRESLGCSTRYSLSSKDFSRKTRYSASKKDVVNARKRVTRKRSNPPQRKHSNPPRSEKSTKSVRAQFPASFVQTPPTPRQSLDNDAILESNVQARLQKLKKEERKQILESKQKENIIRRLKIDLALVRSTFKYDPLGLIRYFCPKLSIPKGRPTKKEIQRLYRKALHHCHPDRAHGGSLAKKVAAEEKFKILTEFKQKILATGR